MKDYSKGVLIRTNGKEEYYLPKKDGKYSLEELNAAVGGYIEILPIGTDLLMVLDEEGKLKDKEPNFVATCIALGKTAIMPNDMIVGDVLICSKLKID